MSNLQAAKVCIQKIRIRPLFMKEYERKSGNRLSSQAAVWSGLFYVPFCGIVQQLPALFKSGAMTRAVPGSLCTVPPQSAAQMGTPWPSRDEKIPRCVSHMHKKGPAGGLDRPSLRRKNLPVRIVPAGHGITDDHGSHHGACHSPFSET